MVLGLQEDGTLLLAQVQAALEQVELCQLQHHLEPEQTTLSQPMHSMGNVGT